MGRRGDKVERKGVLRELQGNREGADREKKEGTRRTLTSALERCFSESEKTP
jgi:hypothetical protein